MAEGDGEEHTAGTHTGAPDVFISYASHDTAVANDIAAALEGHVLREIERATAKRHPVVTLRLDQTPLLELEIQNVKCHPSRTRTVSCVRERSCKLPPSVKSSRAGAELLAVGMRGRFPQDRDATM